MYKRFLKTESVEAWFLLFILSVIWGSSYILIKKGLVAFSPMQVGTIRISFAFIVLLPLAIKNLRQIPKGKWTVLFVNGMVGNLIPAVLFALAETKIESSLTGIINALSPLFTLLIAVFVFNFKIKALQVMGLILGLIGAIGLGFVGSNGSLGSMNLYVLLIVIATLCYAISLNVVKAYLNEVSSLVTTSLSILTVGPIALICLFSTDFIQVLKSNPDSFEALGFLSILGIFGTAVGLILYTRMIVITDAVFASSVTYVIPIVAIFWGLLDGERIYAMHIAGMIFILTGIYFVNKSNKTS